MMVQMARADPPSNARYAHSRPEPTQGSLDFVAPSFVLLCEMPQGEEEKPICFDQSFWWMRPGFINSLTLV